MIAIANAAAALTAARQRHERVIFAQNKSHTHQSNYACFGCTRACVKRANVASTINSAVRCVWQQRRPRLTCKSILRNGAAFAHMTNKSLGFVNECTCACRTLNVMPDCQTVTLFNNMTARTGLRLYACARIRSVRALSFGRASGGAAARGGCLGGLGVMCGTSQSHASTYRSISRHGVCLSVLVYSCWCDRISHTRICTRIYAIPNARERTQQRASSK